MPTKKEPKKQPVKKTEKEVRYTHIDEIWDEIKEIQKEISSMGDYIAEMNKQIRSIATRVGVEYEL